jgi:hypothetical protein
MKRMAREVSHTNQKIAGSHQRVAVRGGDIGLGAFLSTLLNTARFWSDNQMLIAPGVRDRAVNVALREDEGGLNLDMTPDIIADLTGRRRAC